MQGPVTVFDGGTYAGDAQLPDLPPNGERLLSYAMDLDTEVATATRSQPEQLVSVKIQRGVMTSVRKYRQTNTYTVKNSGDAAKNLLIEHPVDVDWKLVAPEKPSEETRSEYRFRETVAPGATKKLDVVQERTQSQSISLSNVDDNSIRLYLSSGAVSSKVKAALQEVVRLKQELAQILAQIGDLQRQEGTITSEQDRIRQNMQAIDRNTDLYRRYVKKLTDQEDDIDKIRKEAEKLRAVELKKRNALDEYLIGLDVS
jgi:hypothetical protein